jgi:hypothetical protein
MTLAPTLEKYFALPPATKREADLMSLKLGGPPAYPGVLKRLFGEIGFRSFARGFFLPRGTIIPILFVAIPAGEHCNAR